MKYYYHIIDPKKSCDLLFKGAIAVWRDVSVFWILMSYFVEEEEEEKISYGRYLSLTSEKYFFYKAWLLSALCFATVLQKVPFILKYFDKISEQNEKFDQLKDKGILYYTELLLFPLFYMNDQTMIVEMMASRGIGLSNTSLLDIIFKTCYYDSSVSYADRNRFFCCMRSHYL